MRSRSVAGRELVRIWPPASVTSSSPATARSAAICLQEFPPTLLDVLRLQGVGPKTVALLYRDLHIKSLDDLAAAAKAGRVRGVKGMGAKKEELILRAIEERQRHAGTPSARRHEQCGRRDGRLAARSVPESGVRAGRKSSSRRRDQRRSRHPRGWRRRVGDVGLYKLPSRRTRPRDRARRSRACCCAAAIKWTSGWLLRTKKALRSSTSPAPSRTTSSFAIARSRADGG